MRKSITTRYFYSTAILLLCSIAVMGLIQLYLATGYFREENGEDLMQTIDNAILVISETVKDPDMAQRARDVAEKAAQETVPDVLDIQHCNVLTARSEEAHV